MSIGLDLKLKMDTSKFQRGYWSGTLEMLYEEPMDDISKISKAVKKLSQKHKLDGYGTFRLVWELFEQLGLKFGRRHRTFSQALHHKNWSKDSCLVVLIRILRNNGLRVVPLFDENSVGVIFDTPRDYDLLNSYCKWFTRNDEFLIKGVTWDGLSKIGQVKLAGKLPRRIDIKEEQKLRSFSFRTRRIPSFVKQKGTQKKIPFYETSHHIKYYLYPYLTSYLCFFPAFRFGEQIELAWQEVKLMGFERDLLNIRRTVNDEVEFMSVLCRSIQSYTTYEIGPLRPISDILTERKGDCDQLSMFISALLLEVGYTSKDIIGCYWDSVEGGAGHVLLAIRPQEKGPEDGAKIIIPDRGTYFCLDPTYYLRSHNKKLRSSWGKISDKYRGRTTSIPTIIRNIC